MGDLEQLKKTVKDLLDDDWVERTMLSLHPGYAGWYDRELASLQQICQKAFINRFRSYQSCSDICSHRNKCKRKHLTYRAGHLKQKYDPCDRRTNDRREKSGHCQ